MAADVAVLDSNEWLESLGQIRSNEAGRDNKSLLDSQRGWASWKFDCRYPRAKL